MRELLTKKEILNAIASKTILEISELRDNVPGAREYRALTRGITKKGNALLRDLLSREGTEGLYEVLSAQLGRGTAMVGRVATKWEVETNTGVYTLVLGWDHDGGCNSHSWWELRVFNPQGRTVKLIKEQEEWD